MAAAAEVHAAATASMQAELASSQAAAKQKDAEMARVRRLATALLDQVRVCFRVLVY